jgi:hypothetical protein
MTQYTEGQMLAIGGTPWAKGDRRRVYLNDWEALAGLNVETYGSGNIRRAEMDGAEISNAEALRLCAAIGKVYWDAADGQVHLSGYEHPDEFARYKPGSEQAEDMVRRLTAGIATAVAAKSGQES